MRTARQKIKQIPSVLLGVLKKNYQATKKEKKNIKTRSEQNTTSMKDKQKRGGTRYRQMSNLTSYVVAVVHVR